MKGPGTYCLQVLDFHTFREKSMIGQWGGPPLYVTGFGKTHINAKN